MAPRTWWGEGSSDHWRVGAEAALQCTVSNVLQDGLPGKQDSITTWLHNHMAMRCGSAKYVRHPTS
jgi:hypothetical protein